MDGILQPPIGRLDLTYDPDAKTVMICKDLTFNWQSGYSFTMLTELSANGLQGSIVENRYENVAPFIETVRIENPFKNDCKLLF